MKTSNFIITATVLLAGLQLTTAQITTSEIKTEDTGGVTTIEGNLGIGTNNPSEKLHINGNLFMNAGEGFKIYGDTNFFGTVLDGIVFQMQDGNSTGGNTDGGFVFRGYTPTDDLSQDWMVIKTGGIVGIGTTTPKENLHIEGTDILLSNTTKSLHFRTDNLGNAYINNMNNFVSNGSTDNSSLIITGQSGIRMHVGNQGSVGSEALRIDSDGNVGIGIATPSEKLHINGNLFMNAGEGFKIYGDTNFFGTALDGIVFQMQDGNSTGGNTDGGFVFRGYTPTDDLSQDWMVIKSGGNVGIGTTNPDSRLHIFNGDSNGSAHSYSKLTVEDSNHAMVSILTPNDKVAYFGFADTDDGYVGGMQYEHLSDRMIFRVNNHTFDMIINSQGNIGIGTTTPSEKLHVNGKIRATGQVGWPDYVFHKDYQLPKLTEVESYIKTKGHLKDIPSEKEVLKHGIDLTEMDAKLLQKIEELTLYTIEQDKTLKQQQKLIEKLETENKALQALFKDVMALKAEVKKLKTGKSDHKKP